MAARGTRRLEPDREEARGERARLPEPEHAVVSLQRAVGNAAVARLLARAPTATELPPGATHLAEWRKWAEALRELTALAKPPVTVSDIAAANAWLGKVVTTLENAKGVGDRIDLHFESSLAQGDIESEYGAAEQELPRLVRPPMERATEAGTELSTLVMSAVNAASVTVADAAPPALMPLDQVTEWRLLAKRLHALGATFTTMGVQDAAAACQEAALAMLQARSVVSARETWSAGNAIESSVAQAKDPKRARNAVDDIFADSGFSGRQSVEKIKDKDGNEIGEQINDWCGMFVAAGMFRGAGLDKDMRKAFAHTDNVYDFFRYTANVNDERTPLSIWADGRWWLVSEYHLQRGAMRTWMEEGSIDLAKIRPGDVALIRHAGTKPAKSVANHIVMVESFDAASGRLVTIEGNVHEGIRPDDEGEARRNADGGLANSAAVRDSSVVHVRDMGDKKTLTPTGGTEYRERGAKTVFGIGRPSLVDFEDHEYAKQAVPKALETTSPEEMRKNAANAGRLQPRSTMDAAHAS